METACLPAVGMVTMTGGDSAGNAGARWTLSASTEGAQAVPGSSFPRQTLLSVEEGQVALLLPGTFRVPWAPSSLTLLTFPLLRLSFRAPS